MIKTAMCFAYVVVSMILLTPIGFIVVLFSLLGLRGPMSLLMCRVGQFWALILIKMIGCEITVSGRENIPAKGSVCFVSNHGSIFDIVLILRYTGRLVGFVAKKELRMIPLVNMWIFVVGGLFIDRKNLRKAHKTINTGVARIKAGGSMIVFPEGSRSRGQGLLPFHPGALKLATLSGAVIVPVALSGTYDIFERNRRVFAGPVKITFCEQIDTASIPAVGRKIALSDQIHGIIEKALDGAR